MKLYEKTIDGNTHRKPSTDIILIKDGMQIFNPTEEMLIADGWVVSEEKNSKTSEENLLEIVRENLKNKILRYDSSDNVNIFYLNDIPVWLDKATRSGLMLRFQAEKSMGITSTTLWYENEKYGIDINIALEMLYKLEIYASTCYDITQRHLSNIKLFDEIELLEQYDFTCDYPEKLVFNI